LPFFEYFEPASLRTPIPDRFKGNRMSKREKLTRKSGVRSFASASCTAILGVTLLALTVVPLAFSTGVHRYYSIPKFTVLLLCSSVLLPLIAFVLCDGSANRRIATLKRFKCWTFLFAYVGTIVLSTVFGIVPRASFFGSFENRMGLITYFCFLICSIGLVLGIDGKESRLRATAITISFTALVLSLYALVQFFGFDPFVSREIYTFSSRYGPITRVASSLGHADYLGNFLLYTAPVSVSLTLSVRGHIQWLTFGSALASLSAIAISGTRGAWVGILVGLLCLVVLVFKSRTVARSIIGGRKAAAYTAIVLLIAAAVWAISSADGFHNVVSRGKETFAEGLSGSGRTLLWGDAIPMVPAYAFPGCGPEAFRLAFLAYRSEELSKLAPQTVNESSHNSYLDATISFGIPGLIALVALIAMTLSSFLRARRNVQKTESGLLIAGFLSSFVAVLAHNIFIFDQIATGLYFFAFCALAQCCREVYRKVSNGGLTRESYALPPSVRARGVVVLASLFSLVGVWYSLKSWNDDVKLRQMFNAARSGSIGTVISRGNELTDGIALTGDYDLQVASALASSVERAQAAGDKQKLNPADHILRKQALDLAVDHAQRSVRNSLMPTAAYLLLGTLALRDGDVGRLRKAAEELSRIDPHFYGSRWLLAETRLAEGNFEGAIEEARIALSLNPSSNESRSVLERAGGFNTERSTTTELLRRGREMIYQGHLGKARRVILRAIRRSSGPCFDCHIALADVYEQKDNLAEAISELQAAVNDDPVNPEVARVRERIDDLQARKSIGLNLR